ncbi:MAG: CGNR zinc finger domain-containing protein [Hydrogenophaga sp.]|nr:CGNR zinc finger domain-containing protein [Hydrogenophaga sp.]
MTFSWTPHRFSGGALALDVANSVILRFDRDRSIDRFAVEEQLAAFPAAAVQFCAERALFGPIAPVEASNTHGFLRLREAIDRHFRAQVLGQADRRTLADLLEAAALMLRSASSETALEAATARSALQLAATPEPDRLKICGNCGWLFLDRSKNRSRTWCDMAVCGNRIKANRHYRRTRKEDAT